MSEAFKVRVKGPGGEVIFQASVPISESRSSNYDTYNITHLPTDIFSFRNTSARHFSIQGKFVSRTADEATANAGYLSQIRGWALPDFGGSGATPPILTLFAYNAIDINGRKVILRSYSFSYSDDVDYIFTGSEPLPVIMTVSLELDEIYSPEQITAKKWKIDPRSGGGFAGGPTSPASTGTPGKASFSGLASKDIIGRAASVSGLASLKDTGSAAISSAGTSLGSSTPSLGTGTSEALANTTATTATVNGDQGNNSFAANDKFSADVAAAEKSPQIIEKTEQQTGSGLPSAGASDADYNKAMFASRDAANVEQTGQHLDPGALDSQAVKGGDPYYAYAKTPEYQAASAKQDAAYVNLDNYPARGPERDAAMAEYKAATAEAKAVEKNYRKNQTVTS